MSTPCNHPVNTLEDNIQFREAMSKLISDYAQVKIPNKVKTSSDCSTAVVGILNPTIRIRTLLNGTTGPVRLGQTPSLIELVPLPTVGCFA